MFDLFGAEMPLAVRFFLAFLIVLGLIGAAAWAVRRFGAGRLGGAGLRGRQPRLSIIERTNVDGARRWLYLVRRDNIEHLVMIGGPTDIVVESNIVRAAPASRDAPLVRPPAAETSPRAVALPEAATNGSWPLQPESPVSPPRRAPRLEPMPEEPISPLPQHPETPIRSQRDPLAALADDLAAHPLPMAASVTPMPQRSRPAARSQPAEPQAGTRAENRPQPRPEARAEPRMPAQPASADLSAADQSLAEMAQRLEAVLRKPKPAEPAHAPAPTRAAPAPEPDTMGDEAAAPPAPPRPLRSAEAKPARAEAKPKEGKALYDTLEQEMASLLGRPAGKT